MRGAPVRGTGRRSEPRFRLKLERETTGRLAAVVLQRTVRWDGDTVEIWFQPVARAAGLPLEVVTPLLAAVVGANGIHPERLGRPSRPEDPPIDLDEGSGARLALALAAVHPLRKRRRMQGVVDGIAEMSAEEVLAWFARARRGPRQRVLRALRVLLAHD